MKYKVPQSQTLENFLKDALHGIKASTLKNYLKHGSVFVNARAQTHPHFELKAGDVVEINKTLSIKRSYQEQLGLEVLYEDDAIIAINKPSGLLSVSDEKTLKTTAYELVFEYLSQKNFKKLSSQWPLFIVHRLDRDVSGILLFAKDEDSKEFLQENWSTFEKYYRAIVSPAPSRDNGVIENYLKETKTLRVFSQDRPSAFAKPAKSLWKVIKRFEDMALVEVKIETGRKHQIRVHLSEAGYPIVGDTDYQSQIKTREVILLYACRLHIRHPKTDKPIIIECPAPYEFNRCLNVLKND